MNDIPELIRDILQLVLYIDSRPILKLVTIVVMSILITPIFWGIALTYLNFYVKYLKRKNGTNTP